MRNKESLYSINFCANACDKLPPLHRWGDELDHPDAVEALGDLRRLTKSMGRTDPPAAVGIHVEAGAGELGRLLIDARSEVNELVLALLEPAAREAKRDVAILWRRMLDLPIRELPGGVALENCADMTVLYGESSVARWEARHTPSSFASDCHRA